MLHAQETASPAEQKELQQLLSGNAPDKVDKVLQVYRDCKADAWALTLKNKYLDEALAHLEDIAVLSKRKQPLKDLAHFLVKREH